MGADGYAVGIGNLLQQSCASGGGIGRHCNGSLLDLKLAGSVRRSSAVTTRPDLSDVKPAGTRNYADHRDPGRLDC